MFWVDFICVFIVAYMLWMISRWLVLPHLRIFPYIKPQWLWVTLYNIFSYAMNAIFMWILLFLLIVYVTWLIIRRLPNFPIPIKRILLRMSPWRPLDRAGVLPLIDDLRRIVFSTESLERRLDLTVTSLGRFFEKSFKFLAGYVAATVESKPPPKNLQLDKYTAQDNGIVVKPSRKSVNQNTSLEQDEVSQVQDEYLQCIEEGTEPVYGGGGVETAKTIASNQTSMVMCKIDTLTTYSNVLNNRISM